MRFLAIFLIAIIIVGALVGLYYYNEEYRPAIEKYNELLRENRTLAQYLAQLRKETESALKPVKSDSLIDQFPDAQTTPVYEEQITGIKLTLPVGNLFDPGGYKLNKDGRILIKKIAQIISRIDNTDIIVEGHTDNEQIGPSLKDKIPSNWELSSFRAINVVKFLQDSVGISPQRLSAAAYGETRPVADNDTEEGKKQNRRIEIFLRYKPIVGGLDMQRDSSVTDSITETETDTENNE